jgi:cytidylate kinase
MIVAIDGPAGAGKSTVARRLATRLGFRYVDTGAMYRALTWLALERGVALDDEAALAALARENPVDLGADRVEIGGHDVTALIRSARVDGEVSTVARHPAVRAVLRARQREVAAQGDSVLEGRDTGSVVCPDADVKVYLVADAEVRAERRRAERPDVGAGALDTDLFKRDKQDAERMVAADDSVEIDTTNLQVEDVVDRIEAMVRARQAA